MRQQQPVSMQETSGSQPALEPDEVMEGLFFQQLAGVLYFCSLSISKRVDEPISS
jgi:hypothetical protein